MAHQRRGPNRPRHDLKKFAFTAVFLAYRYAAQRAAVLRPILDELPLRPDAVPPAMARLREWWAARVVDLARAGWAPLTRWAAATYAMNCPPFGGRTDTKTRSCGHAKVCPFCYARDRVLEPFRQLETILYGVSGPWLKGQALWGEGETADAEPDAEADPAAEPEALKPLRPDLAVVWFRVVAAGAARAPDGRPVEFAVGTMPAHTAFALDYVRRTRTWETAGFDPAAGTVGFHVCPWPRRKKIAVVRYGVYLVDKAAAEDRLGRCLAATRTLPSTATAAGGVLPADKKGLCAAFERAAAYPKMLARVPAEWLVPVLAGTRRFRAYAKVKDSRGLKTGFDNPARKDGWW